MLRRRDLLRLGLTAGSASALAGAAGAAADPQDLRKRFHPNPVASRYEEPIFQRTRSEYLVVSGQSRF